MKKLFFILLISTSLTSCLVSKEGNWSNADENKARKELQSIESEVRKTLGSQTENYFNCYLEKIINNYKNYKEANLDVEGCEALANECIELILGNQ